MDLFLLVCAIILFGPRNVSLAVCLTYDDVEFVFRLTSTLIRSQLELERTERMFISGISGHQRKKLQRYNFLNFLAKLLCCKLD